MFLVGILVLYARAVQISAHVEPIGARPTGAHSHRVHLFEMWFLNDGINYRWLTLPVGIPAHLRQSQTHWFAERANFQTAQ